MAEIIPKFLILLLLFLSSTISSSRTISPEKTTRTKLDVLSSLEKTRRIFSVKLENQQIQDQEESVSVTSKLSLHLHSRDFLSLSNNSTTDYRSLTLSRLRRDSARAAAVFARVSLAVNGVRSSDLTPEENGNSFLTSESAMEGPIISGSSQGSGEYFSRVGLGQPPKQIYLVLDTGSDVSWAQCQPCADCYQQSDPVFDPSSSSSYSPLSCDSDSCRSLDVSSCRNNSCLYQVNYGDGSYTVGDFATETFALGNSQPVSNVAFGCGHDNEGLFTGAAGLLGLGGGKLSFPSQISAKSFSYCLVDRDSSSTSSLEFGDAIDPNAVTANLLQNRKLDTFYYVSMTGIAVGGQTLSIPSSVFEMDDAGSGGVIVDSGTAITRLQTDAYAAVRDAFLGGTGDLRRTEGVALFDTCYDLSSRTSVEVPTISFRFSEGKELKLPAKNYLIPVDSAGTFCLAFAPTSSALSIVGNVQQQGTRVTFDLENKMVGFEGNKC